MKKASIGWYLVILFFFRASSALNEGECRRPSELGMSSDNTNGVVLTEPLRGFERVLIGELETSFGERLSLWRHFDMLEYNRDLPDFASVEIRSAIRDTLAESLKEFFLVDPETSLPVVCTIGTLIQDNELSVHSIDFGIRRIIDDPYVFLGHSFAIDDEKIIDMQIRACLRNWQYIIPEIVITAPLSTTLALEASARYEVKGSPDLNVLNIEDSYFHNGSLEGGLSYYLGIQGRFLGGQAFLGTGYPEALTVLYRRSF
jgi:hypothetical protein